MNAKEAGEIIKNENKESSYRDGLWEYSFNYAMSKGYLEALKGEEVRILVEAAETVYPHIAGQKEAERFKEALAKFKSVTEEI